MDPTATLANILTHLSDGTTNACYAMADLIDWLNGDGFFPDVTAAVVAAGIVTP
jgi:hypothetical protein